MFKRFLPVVVACALAGTLVACGDDESSTTSTPASSSGGSTTAAAPEGAAAELSSKDVDVALEYTGGTAGEADAGATPISIGWVNQEGGVPAYPDQTAAMKAAVQLINTRLGGIDGHPVEMKTCIVQVEEDGQKCGAQMFNEKVDIIARGLMVFGNKSLYKTVAGRVPILGATPGDGADADSPNVYLINSGSFGTNEPMAAFAAKVPGAKTAAVISSNNPAGVYASENILKPALARLGVQSKIVLVPDTATATDVVSALQAAGATQADVIVPNGLPPMYISVYRGLKQLGLTTPVVAQLFAYDPSVIAAAGGNPPDGWTFSGWVDNPLIPGKPQRDTYVAAMKAAGASDADTFTGDAPNAFNVLLTLAKLGNQIGADNLSRETWATALRELQGPTWMTPGTVKCGWNKKFISLCSNMSRVDTYSNGEWRSVDYVVNPQ